jgi:hypothetical protein
MAAQAAQTILLRVKAIPAQEVAVRAVLPHFFLLSVAGV